MPHSLCQSGEQHRDCKRSHTQKATADKIFIPCVSTEQPTWQRRKMIRGSVWLVLHQNLPEPDSITSTGRKRGKKEKGKKKEEEITGRGKKKKVLN